RTTPSKPLSSKCTLVGPTRTWINEATKNAAVRRATLGTSSSRIRHAPNNASIPATAKPPSHHGAARMPSEMWTAQIQDMSMGSGIEAALSLKAANHSLLGIDIILLGAG